MPKLLRGAAFCQSTGCANIRRNLTDSQMAGWMVTVSIKDDDEIGHEMYTVAISDPEQTIQSALKAANGEPADMTMKRKAARRRLSISDSSRNRGSRDD
jgi:hypothetical protein